MDNHSEVLALILKSEGGLNEDEPEHVGGVSYAGITQKSYEAWLANRPITSATVAPGDVRGLSDRHDLIEAFYTDYFTTYHVWELPEFLQYIFADFVVNAGSAAVKIVQRLVDVDDDGLWGSGTSLAVAEWKAQVEHELSGDPNVDNRLITEFHEQKLAHYENLSAANPAKYGRYLPGWKKRCTAVLSDLSKYFDDDMPTPKAVDEDDPINDVTPMTMGAEPFKDPSDVLASFSNEQLLSELSRRLGA